MPSLNFVASANAVNYCNAVPHFVEIEESTLGVNPIKLKEYLKKIVIFKNGKPFNKNTKRKISCLILLHLFGHPSQVDTIKKVTKKFNIPLFYKSNIILFKSLLIENMLVAFIEFVFLNIISSNYL